MSIHKADYGTIFSVTCLDGSEILDVSGATNRQIYFQRPNNGSILGPKTLVVPNGGSDGIVTYTFLTNELDTVGDWTYQIYLTYASGLWHSDYGKFTVYANLV
jgi:hypothetical protein